MHTSYCAKAKTNVLSSIFLCLALDLKEMEYSAKQTLSLQLWRCHLPFAATHVTLNWYDTSLIFLLPMGRKYKKGSQILRFWRLMPKGEEVLSPKQKDCTTNFQNFHKILFQLVLEVNFQLVSYLTSESRESIKIQLV
jgi:hypothetical protein